MKCALSIKFLITRTTSACQGYGFARADLLSAPSMDDAAKRLLVRGGSPSMAYAVTSWRALPQRMTPDGNAAVTALSLTSPYRDPRASGKPVTFARFLRDELPVALPTGCIGAICSAADALDV